MKTLPQGITALRYILVPMLIVFFATWFFDKVGFDLNTLSQLSSYYLPTGNKITVLYRFQEGEARMLWGVAALFDIIIGFYFLFLSFSILITSINSRLRLVYIFIIGLLSIVKITFFYVGIQQAEPRGILFNLTFDILTASGFYQLEHLQFIYAVLLLINALAVSLPVVCVFAGCAMVIHCQNRAVTDLNVLSTSAQKLSLLLNVASLVMVAGIIHMQVWLHWSATLVENKALTQGIMGLSSAISLYWGATYSIVIVAFFVPLANWLRCHAEMLISTDEHMTKDEASQWIEDHQLTLTPMKQLRRIVMMLAPLLAGYVGDTLTNIVQ